MNLCNDVIEPFYSLLALLLFFTASQFYIFLFLLLLCSNFLNVSNNTIVIIYIIIKKWLSLCSDGLCASAPLDAVSQRRDLHGSSWLSPLLLNMGWRLIILRVSVGVMLQGERGEVFMLTSPPAVAEDRLMRLREQRFQLYKAGPNIICREGSSLQFLSRTPWVLKLPHSRRSVER